MNYVKENRHKFSLYRCVLGCLVSIVFSVILGCLHGTLCAVSFHIYINIGSSLFLGFVLGYMAPFVNYITTQHLKLNRLVVTLFLGLTTWYFSLVVFILTILEGETVFLEGGYVFQNLDVVFYPYEVFTLLMELIEDGYWSGTSVSLAKETLLFLGFLEVLIIVSIPMVMGSKIPIQPYSVKEKRWYKKHIISVRFGKLYGVSTLNRKLRANAMSTIKTFGRGHRSNYTQVCVYVLENEDIQYISVFEISNKHEQKYEKIILVEKVKIPTRTAIEILETWKTKKSWIPFL